MLRIPVGPSNLERDQRPPRQDHGWVSSEAVAARSKYLHWLWQTLSYAAHAKCAASLCRRAGAFGQTVLCTGRVVAAVQKDHSSQLSHQRGLQLEQGQLLLVQQKARVCRWRHGGVLRERGVVPTTFVLGLLTFSDMVHCLKAAGRPAHA